MEIDTGGYNLYGMTATLNNLTQTVDGLEAWMRATTEAVEGTARLVGELRDRLDVLEDWVNQVEQNLLSLADEVSAGGTSTS